VLNCVGVVCNRAQFYQHISILLERS